MMSIKQHPSKQAQNLIDCYRSFQKFITISSIIVQGSREAGKQGSREAGKQGSREAGKQGSREAGKQLHTRRFI